MKLHLGVLDTVYGETHGSNSAKTTGEVAEILERKYGLMAAFVRAHEKDISAAIERSLGDALETMMAGATGDPFTAAMSEIEAEFRKFLFTQEVERVGIKGVPTQAALDGINHRLKHPYAKGNPRRPSFIDTGTLETSFRAWVET